MGAERLAWAGVAALALGTGLCAPRALAPFRAPPRTVLVLDASASVVRTRSGWADWARARLAARAAAARAAGGEVALVRCARDVELLLEPGRLAPATVAGAPWDRRSGASPDDGATDLAGAVRLADALLAGRPEGTLILLGDGSYTGADPRPDLLRLARRGVALEREAPPPPDRPDVALAELRLPRALEAGAPLAAEVELASRGASPPPGARMELEARLVGPGGTRRARAVGPVPEGSAVVCRLDLGRAEAGRTEVQVTARLVGPGQEADAVPENDRAEAVLSVEGALVVAALAPGPGEEPGGELEDWGAWCAGLEGLGGLQVLRVPPGAFAPLAGSVDVVASFDVALASAGELGLADFVAAGGGWLATGGYSLLAEGGGSGPDLAPLRPAPRPARRVLFLVDGSGSMSGAPFDELVRAVLAAMRVAPASDRFELDVFTDAIVSRHVLGPGGADTARAARSLLEARLPRGATDVVAALGEVAAGDGPPALVLLLTDGRDQPPPADLAGAAAALREHLDAAGARLVVVGVGDSQDGPALAALAGDAGPRRASEGLAGVLREELGLGAWTPRGRLEPALRDPATLAPGGLAAAVVGALGDVPLAPLERVQRAREAPGAEVVLEGPAGPVLAVRRHGRGAVAALASAPVRGFAGAWSPRPELLAPLVRALGRDRMPPLDLRRAWSPGGQRVLLAGVPPDWPVQVRARFPDGSSLPLTPPAEVPGADPRGYRSGPPAGGSTAGPPGSGGPVTLLEGGEPPAARTLGVAADRGGRDAECGPSPRTLGPLPDLRSEPPAGAAAGGRGHPAAPWLLGLGLACLALAAALGWDPGPGSLQRSARRSDSDGGPPGPRNQRRRSR